MNSEILKRKNIITKNNEEIRDLTSTSVQYIKDNPSIINQIYVSSDMQMRPDLISKVAYSRTEYFDILFKFNGISNPYSIGIEDEIFVPDLPFLTESLTTPQKEQEDLDITNQYLDPNKTSDMDPKRIEYHELVKKMFKLNSKAKFTKYSLPPNLAQPGDTEGNFIDNANMLLGGNITRNTNK